MSRYRNDRDHLGGFSSSIRPNSHPREAYNFKVRLDVSVGMTAARLSGGEMAAVIQTDATKYCRSEHATSVPKYGRITGRVVSHRFLAQRVSVNLTCTIWPIKRISKPID
jgi:hypothetical protein